MNNENESASSKKAASLPAVFLQPGEGELIDYHDGDTSLVLASDEATGGAFSVVEHRLAPGETGSPPLHRHRYLCDAFYVLEGTLTVRVGDRQVMAGPGAFACFPPGIIHTFLNQSASVVRVLNINAPGGWDQVLRTLARAGHDTPVTRQETGEIASTYDMEVIAE